CVRERGAYSSGWSYGLDSW
nr:immunoglobulin heavy chain junction region [Macaca mulatta]MOW19699.1 immunoglobulin heavy chain junction region [Macaca mulatta]MOW20252.1 immunoglobulin heavy chain junction region [Macaca mulatta]MOW20443.1 immunoglobulin heavy chain junction region [Macaca mulatta]MOW20463.1 immunoglobulin heavy chain junction region [Macaca mulatta]